MIFPKPFREEYFDGTYAADIDFTSDLLEFTRKCGQNPRDFTFVKNEKLSEEEYKINIDEKGIYMEFAAEKGKFRSLTSLYQIVKRYGRNLPYAKIHDKPAFKNRGYMLDISRNKIAKPQKIFWIIDFLAKLKFNQFQLYMENLCFKYGEFPEYTKDYDCLTPEDITEIQKYCEERYIELVPCQNGFGHMRAWLDKGEFRHIEITDGKTKTDTLDPINPESFQLVEKIYKSLLPYFKSDKVNICFDEAMGLGMYQNKEACDKYGKDNVFMDYMNKVAALCKDKYKKNIMFWDDMIINYPQTLKRLPKDAVALEWGYDLIFSQMMEARCIALKNNNVRFYTCPSTMTFNSFTGRFDVMSFNMRTAAELGEKYGAEGYLVTEWGDGGNLNNYVWSLVPLALGGQYSWNTGVKQHGGWLKPEFIHHAEEFVDEFVFGAKLSRKLYQFGNLYEMEPERIHGFTMCAYMLAKPLNDNDFSPFFNLDVVGDEYYFDNIIYALKKLIADVQKIDTDDIWKRSVTVNAKMNLLGAEYAIVKMKKAVTKAKADELIKLSENIVSEAKDIWLEYNYSEGMEESFRRFALREKELKEYIDKDAQ